MPTPEDETRHQAVRMFARTPERALLRATASLLDRVVQLCYVLAYRAMRVYWAMRHPSTKGALVAIWSGGQVLLVRNSYLSYYSAPGGYVRPQENAREAALRELLEEVGMSARAEDLELALDITHEWEGKLDHVQIFNLKVDERPELQIDHREVVEATWFNPREVLGLNVFPPLKRAIASAS